MVDTFLFLTWNSQELYYVFRGNEMRNLLAPIIMVQAFYVTFSDSRGAPVFVPSVMQQYCVGT